MRSASIADRAQAPSPPLSEAAKKLGKILAENSVRLIYGGGSVGLMGALAEAVLEHGGEVTGIIPEFLTRGSGHSALAQELIVTRDMHERKRVMFERADAFVALPGGVGTLEELVEQLTWAQLGRHKKPILIANISNYWDPLLTLIEHMRAMKFVPPSMQVGYSGHRNASKTSCRCCATRRGLVAAAEEAMASRPNGCDRHALPRKKSPPRCGCRRGRG